MNVLRLVLLNKYPKHQYFIRTFSHNLLTSCSNIKSTNLNNCSYLYNLNYQHLFIGYNSQVNYVSSYKFSSARLVEKSDQNEDEYREKIIYNSVIKYRGFVAEKRRQFKLKKIHEKKQNTEVNCISLKFFTNDFEVQCGSSDTLEQDSDSSKLKYNLPYSIHTSTQIDENNINNVESNYKINGIDQSNEPTNDETESSYNDGRNVTTLINDNTATTHNQWMFDYEYYEDEQLNEESDDETCALNYGTPNPDIPVSQVPCGGCGALLHCQDPAIPGYLPTEIFCNMNSVQMRAVSCQRCHFLKEYNTALAVNVDPQEYPKILSQIKNKKALVILMVDMTDFPCSIWPGILDIIGQKRPIFVVGNKIDLLQGDSKKWLTRAQEALMAALPMQANVKHVSLISAKTGFGVEELINSLYNIWEYRGDVYLVGCTNVGKSTLFNVLLQSDYAKVKAADLLQRATTSPWPGTTLNLLKFPIMRPEGWRLFYRTKRLNDEKKILQLENNLKLQQHARVDKKPKQEFLQLIGHVGQTFKDENKEKDIKVDPFSVPGKRELAKKSQFGLDPDDPAFAQGRWMYDTPGTVQPDQIIDLLTIDELMMTLPKEMILPRTFQIHPNQSLFIAGLGRLDYLSGGDSLKFTVFSSIKLPVTVCDTSNAEEIYNYYLGTKVLRVPFGDENRMKAWPGLSRGQEFALRGISHTESCADVVLSSAGWVSVTPGPQEICKFLAWTPQARGIHIRIPPVLPYAVKLRGGRISQTIAYSVNKPS